MALVARIYQCGFLLVCWTCLHCCSISPATDRTQQINTLGGFYEIVLLVSYIVTFLAKMTVTPSDVVVTPGQKKVSIKCQLSNLSPQSHLIRLVASPDPDSLKPQSGSTLCSRKKQTCTITFTKIYKEHAVWYSCIAHIRAGNQPTNDAKTFVIGKQFRLDMKSRGYICNSRFLWCSRNR